MHKAIIAALLLLAPSMSFASEAGISQAFRDRIKLAASQGCIKYSKTGFRDRTKHSKIYSVETYRIPKGNGWGTLLVSYCDASQQYAVLGDPTIPESESAVVFDQLEAGYQKQEEAKSTLKAESKGQEQQ